jgi:hypothetical protein
MITLAMLRNLMVAAAILVVLGITMGYQHGPRPQTVTAVVDAR